ncbi:hypothetical protein [Streptomyces sp. NPDC058664]|uniref:hypothetical protein n=1 Tax=unclassified Streptomyces TaxID=2593676 RepID=UPI003669C7AC
MNFTITPQNVTDVHGLNGVTYFPHLVGSRMHPGTARFLVTVGLPSSKLFSTRLDLDTPGRLECRPSLKAAFDADGRSFGPRPDASA